MHSGIYEGRIRHRRFAPVLHEFSYRLFLMYLDLAELDQVFDGRWFWSTRPPAVSWFRREDHLGDPAESLSNSVRKLVAQRTGRFPEGPIRLLTNLRMLGYVINPVSFYYCFDEADQQVETVVAEVHNTPWGEQHCYVLNEDIAHPTSSGNRYRHPKEFHVSPFLPMEMEYRWHMGIPKRHLTVQIENHSEGEKRFDATLLLRRREISGSTLARMLCRYPMMTGQAVAGIYWQALRLWWKKCPFYPHPKVSRTGAGAAS